MNQMSAIEIDRFGGPEVLSVRKVPMPEPEPDQILVGVASAGIGIWDAAVREGMLAKRFGIQPVFPWILGSEGAGKVQAVGDKVEGFRVGDSVFGHAWQANPLKGFLAQYTTLRADSVYPAPSNLPLEQSGALVIDGATALRGLVDGLHLKEDEKLMIFGASGGIGHLAVQFAKRLGAQVFAVASGKDGVDLALRLGADIAVDGRRDDVVASARKFAPNGLDAALITVRGQADGAVKATESALTTLREGGRVAYPWTNEIAPPPKAPSNVQLVGYMGNMDGPFMMKLNKLVEAGPFEVHLGKTFTLDHAVDAFEALNSHHLGRLAILPEKN
jgi:NADPH:quinone reductase